jgi:hypothetical protein
MNHLVSRVTEFLGKDGKIYNALWGPVTVSEDKIQVGGVTVYNTDYHTLTVVPCPTLPKTTANIFYSEDTRMVRVYDATQT